MKNRIRETRKAKQMTMKALGVMVGVAESTISQYETGKRQPDNETLLKIGEALGVSVSFLLGEGDPKENRIPVLGSVPAGIPIEAIEDIVDWEDIPETLLRGGKEYFGLRVDGDSMYPKYLPGDIVIVRKQPTCDNGNDCVVYVNGYDATLKTVHFQPDGSLTIQPINPNYPPRTFTPEEIKTMPVSIAGVVVELRRKVL